MIGITNCYELAHMNLRQIEVFRAVMITGSVTGAAHLLSVSQPGISRMLGHIELQLGLTLFQRLKGKLRPTPEAQTLYNQVVLVYQGVKRIEDCARELKTGGGLALRLLASPSISLEILPKAVAETTVQFPDSNIYMETQLVREIVGQLLAGDADLAIASLPVDHPLLQCKPIGKWSLCCVFHADHHFASRRTIGPRDILNERLIAFSPDTPQGKALRQWSAEVNLPIDSKIEVRSGQVACALAASGSGVSVVDTLTAHAWRHPNLAFRPITKAPTFNAYEIRNVSTAPALISNFLVTKVKEQLSNLRGIL